ncbi:UDP-glycosyltransferase 90A1 [Sesamum angolense]|uniref:UDP-glycosyltransferase 90A1 n=1 Tax=Sesamum angolense TaxID=2727404 RepID=A0AAE1WGT6_9LAMI|nr:UDP-glycosyltransferase 90A1 [Sesamum angolense]
MFRATVRLLEPFKWMQWLDQKLAQNCPVLYVAFGSQTKISPTQLREIALGLEEAKVSFLWVMRESKVELRDGFEDKGISAEVPILAWPMMAEQHLNARMVEEEMKVGLRVNRVDGSAKGFVTSKSLMHAVLELMEGEKGKAFREKVKEVAMAARKAMAEGGSSWHALNNLLSQTLKQKEINSSKFN